MVLPYYLVHIFCPSRVITVEIPGNFRTSNSPPKVHHVPPRVFSLAMRAARFFPSKKPDPFSASPEAAGEAAGPS